MNIIPIYIGYIGMSYIYICDKSLYDVNIYRYNFAHIYICVYITTNYIRSNVHWKYPASEPLKLVKYITLLVAYQLDRGSKTSAPFWIQILSEYRLHYIPNYVSSSVRAIQNNKILIKNDVTSKQPLKQKMYKRVQRSKTGIKQHPKNKWYSYIYPSQKKARV